MSSDLGSKLPRDPQYWNRLTQRINADAVRPLAAYASRAEVAHDRQWYGLLARRAPWLVAASAAAAMIMWLALPARDSVAIELISRSLAPNDGAGTLISGTNPPAVDELLVQFSALLEEEERR